MTANKSLQLTFDSPLGLATPSPPVESNAAELRCYVHWKMKFLKRITGFSTAFFGFSWTNSERRAVASQLFREGVIDDLKGFYPAPGDWPKGFEAKLRAAVSNIEVRVQKFRHFVPEKDRSAFDSAWDLFKSHGLNLSWNQCAAYVMYPTMHAAGSKNPKDIFYERTESLLQYGAET